MTKDEIIRRLLSAFLHDPIDKPYILMQEMNGKRISHEHHAKELAAWLHASIAPITGADWIAAGMERLLLPKGAGTNSKLQVKFLEIPEIRHPLSGVKLESCAALKNMPLEMILDVVQQTAQQLANDDQQKLYLNVWRNYLERLQAHSPVALRKFWPVIPADTRIPDHSIVDHLRTASACAHVWADGNELRHDLAFLLFSIGPVQPFIETARKTQDLWMGSFLLSYLIWEGMKLVVKSHGPDAIIFPDLYQQPLVDDWLAREHQIGSKPAEEFLKLPTLPNRFLAILPADKAQTLAEQAEQQINDEFMQLGKEALQAAIEQFGLKPKHKAERGADEKIQRQLASLLNIYWVVVPWQPLEFTKHADSSIHLDALAPYLETKRIEEKEKLLTFFANKKDYPLNVGAMYGELHSFTEHALAARKNCRDFRQHEERGRKCSLCGERQALFQRHHYPRDEKKTRGQQQILEEKEQLCAVCMTKRMAPWVFQQKNRLGWQNLYFPSISEVAAADFKQHVLFLNDAARQAFAAYVRHCREIFKIRDTAVFLPQIETAIGKHPRDQIDNIHGQYFFDDYLTEEHLQDALETDTLSREERDELDALHQELHDLKKQFAAKKSPSTYYAVIALDGDNMGKWLKGEKAPRIEDIVHSEVWKNLPDDYKQNLKELCSHQEEDTPRRPMSPAIHRAISRALREYALTFVRTIVEERHLGKLIYAGGDDVLALVNLRDLMAVMLELRAAFSGHLDGNFTVNFSANPSGFVEMGDSIALTMGPTASVSMGVAIAYYKTPLSQVLQRARQMEKAAKKLPSIDFNGKTFPEKDGFGISLMKHSGDAGDVTAKWRYPDHDAPYGTLAIVQELVELFHAEKLSPKFLYTLRTEFTRLVDNDGVVQNAELMRWELQRILLRSGKTANADPHVIEELAGKLFTVFKNLGQRLAPFISLLSIAKFLAQEVKQYDKN